MGLLPMYMFDNDEWLPYKGSPNDVILSANCSTEAQTAEGNTKTANSFFLFLVFCLPSIFLVHLGSIPLYTISQRRVYALLGARA